MPTARRCPPRRGSRVLLEKMTPSDPGETPFVSDSFRPGDSATAPGQGDPSQAPPATPIDRSTPRRWLIARTLGSLLLGWAAVWAPVVLVGKGLVPLIP